MGFRSVEKKLSQEALGAYRVLQDYQDDLDFDDLSDLYYQERFREIIRGENRTARGTPYLPTHRKKK